MKELDILIKELELYQGGLIGNNTILKRLFVVKNELTKQLNLGGVVNCNCDKDSTEDLDYDVVHLVNDTYQVVGRQTKTAWKQGTIEECNDWVQL